MISETRTVMVAAKRCQACPYLMFLGPAGDRERRGVGSLRVIRNMIVSVQGGLEEKLGRGNFAGTK